MKVIQISKPGGPEALTVVNRPDPQPDGEEVVVRIAASGVNRADILQRMGKYPAPKGEIQDVPGLEFAGVVQSCGRRASRFRVGERVMGLTAAGAYAERIALSEELLLPVPSNLSLIEAAALPEAFLTAYDALFLRLGLSLGDRLLIHAVGSGVGTAALQLAREAGAVTFGTAGTEEKLRRAKRRGLDYGFNYRQEEDLLETIRKAVGPSGITAILDLVGAVHWSLNLEILAPRGRLLVVGLVSGRHVEADLGIILSKRLLVEGTVLRSRPHFEKVDLIRSFEAKILPGFERGALQPVVDRVFSWEEAAQAHLYMEKNRNFGKILLRWRDEPKSGPDGTPPFSTV